MSLPLAGRTIALAEGRQLEELAQMLVGEGATPWRCPLVSILDAPDEGPVRAWLADLIVGRFAWVILLTGEGLRRLLACADRHGQRRQVIDALVQTKLLTRGPKPVRALKEVGLVPTRIAPAPTTEGVIAALHGEALHGLTVGVQLYKEDNPPLIAFLTQAGAEVRTVLPYIYAPASDAERVGELLTLMAQGKMDALVFTSSPQVDRLYEVAEEKGLLALLQEGLAKTQVAAVGPIVADNLRQRGARVTICPDQGFVMKNLVQLIKRALASGAD